MLVGDWITVMDNYGATVHSEFVMDGNLHPLIQGVVENCLQNMTGFQINGLPFRQVQTMGELTDCMQEMSGQPVSKEVLVKMLNSSQYVTDPFTAAQIVLDLPDLPIFICATVHILPGSRPEQRILLSTAQQS